MEKPEETPAALMTCIFNYPYLDVTIKYSQLALDRWLKGERLDREIMHEMCHVITDPFYAKAVSTFKSRNEIEDEREMLTDYICNIALSKCSKIEKP